MSATLLSGECMKDAGRFPLAFRGLLERWRDGDLLPDMVAALALPLMVIAIAGLAFGEHTAVGVAFPMGGAMLGGALSRLSMRLPLSGQPDRDAVVAWLLANGYREGPRGWVPDLPRVMRMRSDTFRLTDTGVIGPRRALHMLRRALIARSRVTEA